MPGHGLVATRRHAPVGVVGVAGCSSGGHRVGLGGAVGVGLPTLAGQVADVAVEMPGHHLQLYGILHIGCSCLTTTIVQFWFRNISSVR